MIDRGAAVAQLLGYRDDASGHKTIQYLTLSPQGGEMVLTRHHVIEADNQPNGFADLGEMPEVARWEPTIEQLEQRVNDPAQSHHPSVATALDAAQRIGAVDERWTNESMIDLEYDDLRRGRWPQA